MPLFEGQTPEAIRSRALARMDSDLQTREGSFSYDMASPLSFELWRVMMSMNEFLSVFYVDERSGPYLDEHANLVGIEARRQGTKATCEIHFTGKDGTEIPAGTSFFTASGLEYRLTNSVTILNGTATGIVEAAEVGDIYNTDPGEINQILRNISGLESYIGGTATGGTDPETDEILYGRIDRKRKNPSTSGNENHYKEWALECDGVGGVKVTPCWNGPGTVRVLISGYEYEPVDNTVVEVCAAHIQTKRPVGANITVVSAGSLPLNITAEMVLAKNANLETVKAEFEAALSKYLDEVATAYFREEEVYDYVIGYKRIAALLICVDGVVDYTTLTVNGGTENIIIDGTTVPVTGEVQLT